MKKALLITTVSGFVPQFEMENVYILQSMGFEVHYAANYDMPSYGMTIAGWKEQGLFAIRLISPGVPTVDKILGHIINSSS